MHSTVMMKKDEVTLDIANYLLYRSSSTEDDTLLHKKISVTKYPIFAHLLNFT